MKKKNDNDKIFDFCHMAIVLSKKYKQFVAMCVSS